MIENHARNETDHIRKVLSCDEGPLRLVAEEPATMADGDIEVDLDQPWPLLQDGVYRAKFIKQEIVSLRMFKGATRLFVHFQIIDANGNPAARIYGAWPISVTSQAGKKRIAVSSRSNIYIMLCRVFGYRSRPDRISFQPLKGCIVKVRTRTIKKNFRQRTLPECMWYSVLDEIIEIETGVI